MPTDTTQAIAAATSQTAKYVAAVAAIAGAFLAGVMLATSAGDYGVGLSNTGWDLARGGMILCSTIAVLAGMTWWGVEQVVRRLAVRLDRNGYAARAVADELAALRRELARGQAAVKPSPFDHDVKAAVADIASFIERR